MLVVQNIKDVTDIKQFILLTYNAVRSLKLYPANNPIPTAAIDKAYQVLKQILNAQGKIYLKFSRKDIFIENEQIEGSNIENKKIIGLANHFCDHGISSLVFLKDITKDDFISLLNTIIQEPDEIREKGGIQSVLEPKYQKSIKVNEIPQKVSFSESEPAEDISDATASKELRVLDLLSSLIFKEEHTKKEERLLGHLLSKPQDLKTLLTHIAKSEKHEGFNINLLERAVIKLEYLCKRRAKMFPNGEENIVKSIINLNSAISDRLTISLLFSSIRNVSAKRLVSRFSPEALGEKVLHAHDTGASQIERVGSLLPKLELEEETKNLFIDTIRTGLTQKGYSREELELILEGKKAPQKERKQPGTEKGGEPKPREKAGYSSSKEKDKKLPEISPEEILANSRDVRLLEILRNEAGKYRSDEHIALCLLSMIPYVKNENTFEVLNNSLSLLLPGLANEGKFSSITNSMPYLKKIKYSNRSEFACKLADTLLKEFKLKKYIYQAFEVIANSKPKSNNYAGALEFLKSLPREEVVHGLIDILATEELLSRRKLLIDIISGFGSDSLDTIIQRLDDSRWFLVRNMVTILAIIGDKKAIPHLEKTLSHHDIRVRKETIKALGKIGGKQAFEILRNLLKTEETDIKLMTIKSIGNTREPNAIFVLRPIINKKDVFYKELPIKLAAIEALGKLGTQEAINILQRLTKKRSFFFRRKAKKIASAASQALKMAKTRTSRQKGGEQDAPQ